MVLTWRFLSFCHDPIATGPQKHGRIMRCVPIGDWEMNLRFKLAASTALALLLVAPAIAQDHQEAAYLGRIIIGYSEDGTPIYAGENTSYIEGEQLQDTGGNTSVDDILRRQTSVFTLEDPGNPAISVNIRGFEGSGRVAVSVDGVPQNYRVTGHTAQSAAYVDENMLSSIDITRGAVTTVGGSGIAGSVNLRTISAEDVVRAGQKFGGLARLGYGDNGDENAGMLAVGYLDDRFSMLFAVSGTEAHNYEDGDGAEVANTGPDVRSTLFKMGFNIDDRQSLSFSANHYETDFFATSYDQEVTSDTYTLGYKFRSGSLWNLDLNAYVADTEAEYVGGTGSYIGRVMSTRTTGVNATNVSEFSLGGWTVTSANGFDFSRDELGGSGGGVHPTDGTTTRAALFSENIFVNGNWEVTAGVRANSYNVKGQASQGGIDQDYDSVDPKLTLAYQVNDWMQPYVTWSQATRMPTLQETMLGGTHPGGGMGMIANPDLRPEKSTGYEIGFNINRHGLFNTGDRLSGRVNYYKMDVEDYVTASYPNAFTNAFGQTGIAFVNLPGTAKTSGLELELNYAYDLYELGLTYTKNDSDMPSQIAGLGAGQYLPDQTLSLRIATHLMDKRLTIGGQYNYVSGGLYSPLYTPTPVQRDSDYELFDMFAIYRLSDNVTLNAKISNLFDATYVPWLSNDQNGPGRTYYIGTNILF
ncbi:hemoglobin/transferrin/lactoferrin receptor protein [Thalassovita litoralis]|uniref:Hemoglobin/transferrin/lactoferrin receptor protein n=2 Tax=Thalassovita litoralis TaxID=1010611 RepID=A0A521AZ87_9RHOB|nr:hemoglobin/transferrin/lactoferrin receptor protein [Thalassovita litoralis]